jgi:uncharacterized protein YndB with AHSA1/START domain
MGGAFNKSESPWADWPIDREIVLGRVIDAPRDVVFSAWADPDQIEKWFGPEGMTIETKEIDLNPGGVWRFDMVAPDGTRYSNRMVFLRIESPTLLEIEHGSDQDNDPGKFIRPRSDARRQSALAPSNMAGKRWRNLLATLRRSGANERMSPEPSNRFPGGRLGGPAGGRRDRR